MPGVSRNAAEPWWVSPAGRPAEVLPSTATTYCAASAVLYSTGPGQCEAPVRICFDNFEESVTRERLRATKLRRTGLAAARARIAGPPAARLSLHSRAMRCTVTSVKGAGPGPGAAACSAAIMMLSSLRAKANAMTNTAFMQACKRCIWVDMLQESSDAIHKCATGVLLPQALCTQSHKALRAQPIFQRSIHNRIVLAMGSDICPQ